MYKPCGIKETMCPSKFVYKCVHCSLLYTTFEGIKIHVFIRVYSNIAYQHDDEDTFVSKCN